MNITNEGRSKGAKQARKNRDLIPRGGITDPVKANAEFAHLIGDKCFCNRKCKCGKRPVLEAQYINPDDRSVFEASGWRINENLGHHSVHAVLAVKGDI